MGVAVGNSSKLVNVDFTTGQNSCADRSVNFGIFVQIFLFGQKYKFIHWNLFPTWAKACNRSQCDEMFFSSLICDRNLLDLRHCSCWWFVWMSSSLDWIVDCSDLNCWARILYCSRSSCDNENHFSPRIFEIFRLSRVEWIFDLCSCENNINEFIGRRTFNVVDDKFWLFEHCCSLEFFFLFEFSSSLDDLLFSLRFNWSEEKEFREKETNCFVLVLFLVEEFDW